MTVLGSSASRSAPLAYKDPSARPRSTPSSPQLNDVPRPGRSSSGPKRVTDRALAFHQVMVGRHQYAPLRRKTSWTFGMRPRHSHFLQQAVTVPTQLSLAAAGSAVFCESFSEILCVGWGGRIRTCAWRHQKPLPYRLATPQRYFGTKMRPPRLRHGRSIPASAGRWQGRYNPSATDA